MTRAQRLLHHVIPYAVLAALAPIAPLASSSEAEACDADAHKAAATAPIESTLVLVVKFHADWCGACQMLSGPLESLQGDFAGQPVDFVRFDLSNEATTAASRPRAARLGLSEIFESYGTKTGFVLVIDAETNRIVGEIRANQDFATMSDLLARSLGEARS